MGHVVSVRVSDQDYNAFNDEAEVQGVPLSTCLRMLALRGLRTQNDRARAESLLETIEGDVGLMLKLRRLLLLKV